MNLALHGFLLQVLVSILDFQHGSLLCSAGEPGYLDFDNLPETNFSCQGKVIGGYYADVEAGCQMFHVCTIGQKDEIMDIKFLCLNGTVFDQETRVCERVDEVDCSKSERFYNLNLELYGNNAVTLSLHESEDEDGPEIIEEHQQRTTSARPTTTTTTTTTPRPIKQSTTVSSGSFQHSTGYPQHFQPQPPFPQVHTSQSKSLYDDKNGGFHHQYIFHDGERTNNQATSYQLFSNQGVSSTTVQAPQVHQIRFSSTASPQIIHNEPSTVAPLFHATSSTIQTLLNSNANGPALINPIFHNHGIASTTEQFSVHSNNPRETSEYRENEDQGIIRPLEAVQSTNKGKVSKLTISPVPTQSEPSRTVQTKTSQSSQQQRISGNFLPTPATIETTIRSFYPTPRTSPKPSPSSQSSANQVTQHIHIPPPPAIPQLKPHQITISLPPPDIHRIVQSPSPLLPSQSRVIVTAKASVSDESGRPLNTTQLVTLPLPTIPASYDDYKEGDESFDPFYRDVPKIRKHRRVEEVKAEKGNAKGRRRKRSTVESMDRLVYGIENSRRNLTKVANTRNKADSRRRVNDEIEIRNLAAIKDNLMKLRDILYKRRASAVGASEKNVYNYNNYNSNSYIRSRNVEKLKADRSFKSQLRVSNAGLVKQNLDLNNNEDSADELEAGATRNFKAIEKESAGEEEEVYGAENEEESKEDDDLPESEEEVELGSDDYKESEPEEKYERNEEEETPEPYDKAVDSEEYVEIEEDTKPEVSRLNYDDYSDADVVNNEKDAAEEIVEEEFKSEDKNTDESEPTTPRSSYVDEKAHVEADRVHNVEENVKAELSDSDATQGEEDYVESITTVANDEKPAKLTEEENVTETIHTSDVTEAKTEFNETTESVATEENSFTSMDVTQQFIDDDMEPKLPHILDNSDAQDKIEVHKDSEMPEEIMQDDKLKNEAEAESPSLRQQSEGVSEKTEEKLIENSTGKANRRKNSRRKSSRRKSSRRKQHKEDETAPTKATDTAIPENVQRTAEDINSRIFEEPESNTSKEVDARAIVRQETTYPKMHETEEITKEQGEENEYREKSVETSERLTTQENGNLKEAVDGGNEESEESLEKPHAVQVEHSTELTRISEDKSTEKDSSEEFETMEESPTTNISDQDYEDTSQETPNKLPLTTEKKENITLSRQGKSMKFEGNASREVAPGSHRQDKSSKFTNDEVNDEERSTIRITEDTYDDVSSDYHDTGDTLMENDEEADEQDYKENSGETTMSAEYDNSEETGDYHEEEIAEESPSTDESTVAEQESSTEGVLKFTDELPKDKKEESANRKEDLESEVKEVAKDSVHDYVDDNYEPESYKEQESSTRSEVSSDDKTEKKVEEKEKGSIKLEMDGDDKEEKVQKDEGKSDVKGEAEVAIKKEIKNDTLSEGSKPEEVKLEEAEKGEPDLTTTTTSTSTTTTTTAKPTPPKLFKPISARKNYNYIPPTTTPNPVIIKPRFGLFNPKPAKPPKSYNELVPKPVIRKLPLLARKAITTAAPIVTTEKDKNYITETMITTTETSKSEENILKSKLESKDFQERIANKSEIVKGKEDQVPSEQNLPPLKESNDTSVEDEVSATEESLLRDPENFTPYPITRLSTLASTIEKALKEVESKPTDATEYPTTSKSFTLMDIDVISTTTAPKVPDVVKTSDIITGESLDQEENSTASSIKFYHEVTEIIQNISERPVSTSGYVTPQTDSLELGSLDATTRTSGRRSNTRRHTSFNCLEKEMYRFYGDNRDCRLFHYCSPGFTSRQVLDFRFVCEEGTSFDEDSQSCRHDVQNRDCSNRPW